MALNRVALFDQIYRKGLYDDFVNFAIFMRLTKDYSFFNSALILLQRPGAQYIENEEMWERKYDRYIRPDSTPIVVMQPFGPINFVYDFSDTYGENVPPYMRDSFKLPQPDLEIGKWLPRLIEILKGLGIYYGEKDFGTRQGGQAEYLDKAIKYTFSENKKKIEVRTHLAIIVNKNSEEEQKATTILHELGHILCGHLPIDKGNQRLKVPDRSKENLCLEQEEFEAEKVCELICKTLGLEYKNNEYLRGYLINDQEPYFSVRVVIEAADKFIKEMNS